MRALEAEYHAARPSLVVVPLSTLANWAAEARVWAPGSNVIVLHGNRGARQVVRDHELFLPLAGGGRKGERPVPKVGIVLTTYEMVIGDLPLFRSMAWEALVLDEGHRLKGGPTSRGFDALAQLDVAHRVLLTGTPVQNNLEELFNLLHFLRPDLFPSFAAFTAEVTSRAAGGDGGKMAALIAVAQPHMLRRVKRDVLAKLPPRREVHVPVELSPLQTEWYRAMLTRNYELLAGTGSGAGAAAARATKLHNMVMQLRKVANHPYLIDGTEPGEGLTDAAATARLRVAASGKLALLDAMLTQLRARGHRVLVFSQMVRMLDVLEDFCRDRFGQEAFERVDGGVLAGARQAAIARFNEPDSSRFIFLLSTRACGLGINLASADTVVIFDSGAHLPRRACCVLMLMLTHCVCAQIGTRTRTCRPCLARTASGRRARWLCSASSRAARWRSACWSWPNARWRWTTCSEAAAAPAPKTSACCKMCSNGALPSCSTTATPAAMPRGRPRWRSRPLLRLQRRRLPRLRCALRASRWMPRRRRRSAPPRR